jgi:hypothetical protein
MAMNPTLDPNAPARAGTGQDDIVSPHDNTLPIKLSVTRRPTPVRCDNHRAFPAVGSLGPIRVYPMTVCVRDEVEMLERRPKI